MTMIDLKLLQTFCGEDETRAVLMQPSSRNGFTYATDGRIIVRAPKLPDVPDVDGYPNCEQALGRFTADGSWQKLPAEIPPEKTEQCSLCYGSDEHDCSQCKSAHTCNRCDGVGNYVVFTYTSIGARKLNDLYLRKMQLLPSVEINASGDEMSPMSFRFDGGIGLLMPCRKDK